MFSWIHMTKLMKNILQNFHTGYSTTNSTSKQKQWKCNIPLKRSICTVIEKQFLGTTYPSWSWMVSPFCFIIYNHSFKQKNYFSSISFTRIGRVIKKITKPKTGCVFMSQPLIKIILCEYLLVWGYLSPFTVLCSANWATCLIALLAFLKLLLFIRMSKKILEKREVHYWKVLIWRLSMGNEKVYSHHSTVAIIIKI